MTMDPQKETDLIRNQIVKLDHPDFDLEAWKNATILILSRIFGPGSLIVNKIQGLSFHLSSWALRDTLGKVSTVEQVKRNAREMLETAILEIESLGPSDAGKKQQHIVMAIQEALEKELKVTQYRELIQILSDTSNETERSNKVADFLSPFDAETLRHILSSMLTDQRVSSGLQKM